MDPLADFWFAQNMDIIMRICTEDPQESAVQSFVLNQPEEEEDPDTMHFLAKITDLKKRFNEANQECINLERDYPTHNYYLLNERLDANLFTLKREIMDLAVDMKKKHITAHVV
ncbi:uncharacterized protein LOC111067036 [Drosophila obscura]|uniref:uncharacterized protein LOC111067036 n=1 Tax=Drosophila obscura TaxID=7282 RepID=UPI001BB28632|nr:uncharacterized protein LOC111067036 [Drosophila obscura]